MSGTTCWLLPLTSCSALSTRTNPRRMNMQGGARSREILGLFGTVTTATRKKMVYGISEGIINVIHHPSGGG